MIPFFDYDAGSPKAEILTAFQCTNTHALQDFPFLTENRGNFSSLNGRAVCLLMIVKHTASIVLKPAYYLITGMALTSFAQGLFAGMLRDQSMESFRNSYHQIFEDCRVFENNPELTSRFIAACQVRLWTAPAAVLSQMIQVCKAVLGILHPGIYFRDDALSSLLYRLAHVARQVNCQQELIEELDKGSKAIQLSFNAPYFHAEYVRDLTLIVEKLEDPALQNSLKFSILSMLNPDNNSGIKACPAGLGRIFQQMRAAVAVPENPANILPHLLGQFRVEILNNMILEVEHDLESQNLPSWKAVLRRIGMDPAHRGAALTSAIGESITLPEEMIAMANQDYMVAVQRVQLSSEERDSLLQEFNQRNSLENQMAFLQASINSQPDGSPGLRRFREGVIQALSASVTLQMLTEAGLEEGDEANYVITRYQANQGQGDPSGNPGFNDLNADAIEVLLNTPNLFAPS